MPPGEIRLLDAIAGGRAISRLLCAATLQSTRRILLAGMRREAIAAIAGGSAVSGLLCAAVLQGARKILVAVQLSYGGKRRKTIGAIAGGRATSGLFGAATLPSTRKLAIEGKRRKTIAASIVAAAEFTPRIAYALR